MPTTVREQRVFGIGVGSVLVAIASWRVFAGDPLLPWLLVGAPGAVAVLLGLVAPAVLAPVRRAWMRVVAPLAWFNTRLLLGLVYYGILLPSGLIRRVVADPLTLRRDTAGRESYWVDREEPRDLDSYRRMV